MTREEATEKLNRCREILEITSHMDNQNRKAFDMAVKALKQEPCGKDINVPATDCISRQAVKELFQEACAMEMYDFLGIDDIPSVTPQEPVLDKIRDEIKQEYKDECEHPYGQGLRRAIEIIDKYKAESEE